MLNPRYPFGPADVQGAPAITDGAAEITIANAGLTFVPLGTIEDNLSLTIQAEQMFFGAMLLLKVTASGGNRSVTTNGGQLLTVGEGQTMFFLLMWTGEVFECISSYVQSLD